MSARSRLFLGSVLTVLAGGCGPVDGSEEPTPRSHQEWAAEEATLIGGVVTTTDGKPIEEAVISVPGLTEVRSQKDGSFWVTGLEPTSRLPVSIRAPGYASTVRIYAVEAGQTRSLDIPLQALEAPTFFKAEEGTKLMLAGGSTLEILPGSLISATTGKPASGEIRATRAVWEATNPASLAAAPGDYTASDKDGSTALLQSFGMFQVELLDSTGEALTFLPDRPGRVWLPLTEQFQELPLDRVGLFAFDASTGVWRRDQTLRLDSTRTALVGTLPNTATPWNYDLEQETTCVILKVLRYSFPEPVPAVGATATATGNDYNGSSDGFVDANGNVCLNVRVNSSVTINASWQSGSSRWRLIRPLTVNPTPGNRAQCATGGCTVLPDTVRLDLIVGLPGITGRKTLHE